MLVGIGAVLAVGAAIWLFVELTRPAEPEFVPLPRPELADEAVADVSLSRCEVEGSTGQVEGTLENVTSEQRYFEYHVTFTVVGTGETVESAGDTMILGPGESEEIWDWSIRELAGEVECDVEVYSNPLPDV